MLVRNSGDLRGRLHAKKFIGNLDPSKYVYEEDGSVKGMVSVGRGCFLEHAPSIEERASDLAVLEEAPRSEPEWEAVKLGYRFDAPEDAEAVLGYLEKSVQ